MKKTFIFLTVLIIAVMAFTDAKDRLRELDEISAAAYTTQKQAEPIAQK